MDTGKKKGQTQSHTHTTTSPPPPKNKSQRYTIYLRAFVRAFYYETWTDLCCYKRSPTRRRNRMKNFWKENKREREHTCKCSDNMKFKSNISFFDLDWFHHHPVLPVGPNKNVQETFSVHFLRGKKSVCGKYETFSLKFSFEFVVHNKRKLLAIQWRSFLLLYIASYISHPNRSQTQKKRR